MSHRCRQCDGHVMPEDDGGYCSHTCHAEGLIADNDVDAIVRLLRIEAAAQDCHKHMGRLAASIKAEQQLWKELAS